MLFLLFNYKVSTSSKLCSWESLGPVKQLFYLARRDCWLQTGPEREDIYLNSSDRSGGGGPTKHMQRSLSPITVSPHWVICIHATDVVCTRACAYGWCGNTQLANCTLLGPSRFLLPATESQYEIWHHNGRMTKTISTNSLNFTNPYLLLPPLL